MDAQSSQYLYLGTSKASKAGPARRGGASRGCSELGRRLQRGAAETAATTSRQHTSAYVSIRQHTSGLQRGAGETAATTSRQHTSAYVSIREDS